MDHLHAHRLHDAVGRGDRRGAGRGADALRRPSTCPDAPRRYDKKVRNAQEAHEAIRPSGSTFRSIEDATRALSSDGARLYELIWKRTVASEMVDARLIGEQIRLDGVLSAGAGDARGQRRRAARDRPARRVPGVPPRLRGGQRRPRRRSSPTKSACCPSSQEGSRPSTSKRSRRPRTRPSRPRGSPRRRSCAGSRSSGSGARAPTRASSRSSRTATTCGRRAPRSSRRTRRSRSPTSSSATTPSSSTTASPRRWRTTSTRSRTGEKDLDAWLRPFYFGDEAGTTELARLGLRRATGGEIDLDLPSIYTIPIGQDPEGGDVVVRVGRYGATLQRGEERRPLPPETEPDTPHASSARSSCSPRAPATSRSARTPRPASPSSRARAGSARTSSSGRSRRSRADPRPPRCSSG